MVEITTKKLNKLIEELEKEIKAMEKEEVSEIEKTLNGMASGILGMPTNLNEGTNLEEYIKLKTWKQNVEILRTTIMWLEIKEEEK